MLRFVPALGLFAWNRSPGASCRHRTAWCRANCYNNKLYPVYPAMVRADAKNERAWACATGASVAAELDRKHLNTMRVRGCTRGETFSDVTDVNRVAYILARNPDRLFWLPTRAWRNPELRPLVRALAKAHRNARILASVDPSNTSAEVAGLISEGWSTMEVDAEGLYPADAKLFRCPKTYDHKEGHCAVCRGGCFSSRPVHVSLKKH